MGILAKQHSSAAPRVQVVWFKRDLRLADHAPLNAAVSSGGQVLPLFVVEPDYWKLPDVSRRHWHFIHGCLADLRDELAAIGGQLLVRRGSVISVLAELKQALGGFDLHSHEETGNAWTYRRDLEVAGWCRAQGVHWHEYPSHGVARRLKTRSAWSLQRDARMAEPQIAAPGRIHNFPGFHAGDIPSRNHPMFGALGVGGVQQGGRAQARKVLDSFLADRSRKYMQMISKPGVSARHCSRLSAHIAYGTLSVKEVEQAVKAKIASIADISDAGALSHRRNLAAFLSRLAWRCHFVQRLEQQPRIETRCMHPAFEGMREPHHNEAHFEAWKQGRTGYPLVDASMRSLHENGWINFRMRAMLVSFASYHLWLDWRVTAPFLAQLFTDYEPGIHYSQFQMQSGVTGINAIRMYSPVKQSLDHDPEGKFIRRYVPELEQVSNQWIHEPWRMADPAADYPASIVDHAAAVKHARAEIGKRWKSDAFRDTAKGVMKKLGSRAKQPSRKPRRPPSRQFELDL
jgi:deoxyribodipyrimidine photo-lyase